MKLHAALCSFAAISQVLSIEAVAVAAIEDDQVTQFDEVESVPLVQYTPDASEWDSFYSKAVDNNPKNTDHTPDGIGWIPLEAWIAWDGNVIDPTLYSKQELGDKICPGSTVLGLRDVFYQHNPFSDITRPTKAEVDLWHTIAVNHVRALVGYTEEEYIIKPNQCLHLRALWCDQKFRTRMWDTDEYPERCEFSTNPHCGAGFIPSVEDQLEYLPEGLTSCPKRAGSEGMFSAAKSNIPWSMKWARPFCATLKGEGFWGGHTGPWFHRPEFGWGWWDGDPDDFNNNAGLRTKWSGSSAEVKYEDPDITNKVNKVNVEGVNPDPRFTAKECDTRNWLDGGAETATECYWRMMENDDCGKRFMTWNGGGCACYPIDMEYCKIIGAAGRLTWNFEPIQSSFDGLLIDTTKELSGNQLPYNGRRCPNIRWKGKAGDASHCLQIIMTGEGGVDVSDCGRNFITYNTANGGCACYPESQETCTRSESIRESGRTTYELEVDPTWNPPADPSPSEAPSDGLFNAPSTGPSYGPSDGPSNGPSDGIFNAPSAGPSYGPSDGPSNGPSDGIFNAPSAGPSYGPSDGPSDAPSDGLFNAPSTGPSYGPSDGPSDAPSDGPSYAPSRAPSEEDDVNCIENKKSTFFAGTNAKGKEKKKQCKELRKMKNEQKDRLCKKTKIASDGTKPAKDICPVTCKICDCGEIANKKFFFSANKNGKQQKFRTCNWLKKYFQQKPKQAQKICDMDPPDFGHNEPMASDACRITCNTCP